MTAVTFDSLWQYVHYWAESGPDLPAIHYKDQTFSWNEFDELSNNLALSFLKLGVKKGDIIATMLPASPEYLFSLIAADKIGAVICALDVKYKSADLKKFISHLNPQLIIAIKSQDGLDIEAALHDVSKAFGMTPASPCIIVGEPEQSTSFESMLLANAQLSDDLSAAKTDQHKDDDLLIVFTGGTTGVPKAALLSKINVAGMAAVEFSFLFDHLNKEAGNRLKSVVSLPPSHVGGTVELMGMGIVGGMEMFVNDTWSPKHVFETVERERLEWIGGVPTMFTIMLSTPELSRYDLSSLSLVILSGEKTDTELLEKIQEKMCPRLIVGYGSTEAGAEVAFTEPGEDIRKIADGFVGHPLSGYTIRIVDIDGNDLPEEQKGEVLVKSDYTIKKYFRMPAEDEQGFTPGGFCKTGDLGMLDKNGGLHIRGRTKHIIRVGSYTVMPSEIEEVVLQDPSINIAAAIGVPDKVLGEVVWLIANPSPGSVIDEQHLINLCKEQLAKFKVPRRVIAKDTFPFTHIGKINRATLQTSIINQIREGYYDK